MISAVVLSHNDELLINKTLTSLSFCNEVIVVDDNSTDTTVEIAKKNGAKVYSRQLNEDFATQRNFGLSKASGDWALFVDSDEVVSKELADEIQREIASSKTPRNDNPVGYYLKRNDYMWGRELKHGETANVRLLRLAKKNAGKWERPVHEVWNVSGPVGELSYPLLHYPHPNVAQFIEEINWYSTLNANFFYTAGIRTSILQIVVYSAAKFFVNYVWRLGFLDGTPGALSAILMSFHSFLTRAKLYLHTSKK